LYTHIIKKVFAPATYCCCCCNAANIKSASGLSPTAFNDDDGSGGDDDVLFRASDGGGGTVIDSGDFDAETVAPHVDEGGDGRVMLPKDPLFAYGE
jgi:hypothetical protein